MESVSLSQVRRLALPSSPVAGTSTKPGSPPDDRAQALILLAQSLVRRGPPINSARVAELRNQISSGSFAINPGMIADSMLAFYNGADR
jgi:flagellar biosynthesis anti-sigma factor FlgM